MREGVKPNTRKKTPVHWFLNHRKSFFIFLHKASPEPGVMPVRHLPTSPFKRASKQNYRLSHRVLCVISGATHQRTVKSQKWNATFTNML